VPAPSHHRPSLPILLKMERNTDDVVAQEAAAREYQPQLEVTLICCSPTQDAALTTALAVYRDRSSARRRSAQPSWKSTPRPTRSMCKRQWWVTDILRTCMSCMQLAGTADSPC
jgi:hypothetical protein